MIINATGDLMINGQPFIPVGNPVIPDLNGAVIQTGTKGRATILMHDGATVRLGSKSTIRGENLCGASRGPSYVDLGAGAAGVIFPEHGRSLEVHSGNAGGIRGQLHRPFDQKPYQIVLASLRAGQESGLLDAEDRAQIDAISADDEDAAFIRAAIVAINRPSEFFYVKVIKGAAQLTDSNGPAKLLAAGEEYFRQWGSAAGVEAITIRSRP